MSKSFEKIKAERQKLTNQIIENLEKEGNIWKKGWDTSLFSPHNPTNGSVYKGYNKFKLMIEAQEQGYKDPRWMTYKQAQSKGWQIKKGSKGVPCEYWKFEKEIKDIDDEGNKIIIKEKLKVPLVNSFTLFNAEDIDGIPKLPKKEKVDNSELDFLNDTLIKSSECKIEETAADTACYRPSLDKISMPLRESFADPQEFTATLIHEMAHSTGHPDRLNREKGKKFGDELYAKEELRAELSSVFTQDNLNLKIHSNIDNHTAYIKSWIKVLKNDHNEIYRAAADAEKITDRLVTNYRKAEKERIDELLKQPFTLPKDPFRGLVVVHNYSETDLGVEDNTTLRGQKAYDYLQKVIDFDREHHQKRQTPGYEGPTYYKTEFSFRYKEYEKDEFKGARYDLGDGEFGGHTKVSKALDHRLKSHLNVLESQSHHWCRKYSITREEFFEELKLMKKDIEKMTKSLSEREAKQEKTKDPKELSSPSIKNRKIVFPGKNKARKKVDSLEL